jgi:diguanylate cyclase (GGDEF)-like protein
MSTELQPGEDCAEQALGLLIADGAAAAALARRCRDDALLPGPERALAQVVLLLVALREGSDAEVQQAQAATKEALRAWGPAPRAADLHTHAQGLFLRRLGRAAESVAVLEPLNRRADERPVLDACLTAAAMGVGVSMAGDDTAALEHFYQALALARRSGNRSLLVNALNNLGSTQADLFNLEDAAPMLQECLEQALQLGSRRQIIFAAGNWVQCLCQLGQPAQALAVARQHLMGAARADDPPALQRHEEVARALLDNGLVDEAEAWLASDASVDPMSNEMGTARAWLQARLLQARGRTAEALALCTGHLQQQAHGGQGTVAADQLSLLRLAAFAAQQLGAHAQAYELLQQAFAKHEQLLGRAARSRQLSLQITHRLRQAERERDTAQQLAARLEVLNTSLQAQVAENLRLQQKLRAQALEDPLTGLHNRRHLMEAGAALLALLRRRQEPLAVALVDLDHFKRVNDEHGHEAGDQVLCGFAEVARRHTRAEDLACRYGGEEFVLLLPGARAEQAAVRLDALRARFLEQDFTDAEGRSFRCSFSAGVAVSDDSAESLPALLARADAALYAAKEAGRNRVLLAPLQAG